MNFENAVNLKQLISSSVLSIRAKKRGVRTVSFAAGSRAVAVTIEAEMQASVNGVGVGEKQNGENFIKILTRESLPVNTSSLSQYYGIKKEDLVVEKVGSIRFKTPTSYHRPPFPGISVGHYKITAGTLGCFVQDEKGKSYILSNNHVLANTDNSFWRDPILQPGKLDGGDRRKHIIASLSYVVPLSRTAPNFMDAAIAVIENDLNLEYSIYKKGRVAGIVLPYNKMKVEKWGRTTGHTTGSITTRNLDIQVDFDSEILEFHDQFEIRGRGIMFCDGGDSGSLILERGTFNSVGLLFAGNDEGTTYATPISEVLTSFSVNIL